MRSTQVLYVCPNSRKSGAEQLTSLFIRHHDSSKFSASAYFFEDGPLVSSLRAEGISCFIAPFKPRLRNLISVGMIARDIAKIVQREKIGLIHSVMGYGHVFGGLAALFARVPEVWYQHGPTGDLDWLGGRVPTSLILTNSQFTAKEQLRYKASSVQGIQVIHPGVELLESEAFQTASGSFRREGTHTLFGIFGRITQAKGHDLVLKAFRQLLHEHRDVALLIVGDAFMPADRDYLNQLKARVKNMGLDKSVRFTGHLDPPYAAMLACDVVINASLHPEPFGLTLIEAMSLGRPVLAPNQGGPVEIVRNEVDGLLFESGNQRDLLEKMKMLLGTDLRKRIANRGRERAQEHFSIPRMMQELENAYERVLPAE